MTGPGPNVEGEIAHLLAEDKDIAEQGIAVVRTASGVRLRGAVNNDAVRERIITRVGQAYPDLDVGDDLTLVRLNAPDGEEEL